MRIRLFFIVFCLLAIPVILQAQSDSSDDDACPSIVETALASIEEFCDANTSRNQACYGNFNITAEGREGVEDFEFDSIGDIVDVNDLAMLQLEPMDEDEGEWGVALMRLQANLPDTLPGQNVTFILFGDVELINQTDTDVVEAGMATPMQAFYLTTGVGDTQCAEAPESGMLVQTPDGVGEVSFTVNEISVEMGSTVLFQGPAGGDMRVSTLEGSAAMRFDDDVVPIVAGTRIEFPLGEDFRPAGPPPRSPEAYEEGAMDMMPMGMLGRPVEARPPLSSDELALLEEFIANGEPPCGVEPFPSCDDLPEMAGGLPCLLIPPGGVPPEDSERPLCDFSDEPMPEGFPPMDEGGCITPGQAGAEFDPRPACEAPEGMELPFPPQVEGTQEPFPPRPEATGDVMPPPERTGEPMPPPMGEGTQEPMPPRPEGENGELPPPPDGGDGGQPPPPPPNGDGGQPPPPPPPGG